jgi:hypothetical protein
MRPIVRPSPRAINGVMSDITHPLASPSGRWALSAVTGWFGYNRMIFEP